MGISVGSAICTNLPGWPDPLAGRKDRDIRIDLLVKGGHVVDGSQNLSAVRDVAIVDGRHHPHRREHRELRGAHVLGLVTVPSSILASFSASGAPAHAGHGGSADISLMHGLAEPMNFFQLATVLSAIAAWRFFAARGIAKQLRRDDNRPTGNT